ncbi:MAG TPA: amino acid permease, partial [Candidatus Saccharimonadia bacterium]|nr:amino acid permease [Candidatus Saccharimonadia bacterium]
MTTARRAAPLGLWAATALVIGNMIGSGTFLLPSALAPYGGASLVGWAISFAGALLLAGVFAALSASQPRAGGPYAYARASFGDAAGFATGWLYWLSIVCGNAAIAVAFAGSFGALAPAAVATPARAASCAVLALWICTAFNLVGLKTASAVQGATVILKVLPLAAIALVGAFALEPAAVLRPPTATGTPMALAATTAALTLWAFLGL